MKAELKTDSTENFQGVLQKEENQMGDIQRKIVSKGLLGWGWGTISNNRIGVNISSIFYFVPIFCNRNISRCYFYNLKIIIKTLSFLFLLLFFYYYYYF